MQAASPNRYATFSHTIAITHKWYYNTHKHSKPKESNKKCLFHNLLK